MTSSLPDPIAAAQRFFGSAEFSSILTTVIFGTLFSSHALIRMLGNPGFSAMVATLVVAALLSAVSQHREVSWSERIPLTVVVFVLWCVLSTAWTSKTGATLSALNFQVGVALLGLYIGAFRDVIQMVRALGNALRVLLGVSLGLEILSGLLIDMPIVFLGVEGHLAQGGPIQGIFGSRNDLAFVAVIALITFGIEWRTRSVPVGLAWGSMILATALLLLSGSAIQIGVAFCVAVTLLAMMAIRRRPLAERRNWQIVFFTGAALAAFLAWMFRSAIVTQLRATRELETRLTLWQSVMDTARQHPLEGWGWVGAWPNGVQPYFAINFDDGTRHQSALGAFFDLYLQVGLVGLALFVVLLVVALVRSLLVATSRQSVVYLWPSLVLVALGITSLAESTIVTGYGWLLLVIAASAASQNMSWRNRLRPTLADLKN